MTELVDNGSLTPATVRATCGAALTDVEVPGMLTRMGEVRCARCCDMVGYPRGRGSPRNDDAVRPLAWARIWGR